MSSYKTYAVAELDFDVEEIIKRSEQQIFKVANQKRADGSSFRNSNVTWIDESDKDGALPWPELTDHIAKQIHSINNKYWKFNLSKSEPLQYSIYNEGDYYDWHNDQRESVYKNGLVRKLSFTVFLNEDYDGGDFQIVELSAAKELPKLNVENVSATLLVNKGGMIIGPQPSAGAMIVFPSYLWHRVKPVIKGPRKSLVGWFLGEPFK
jgi:PKHD-type hydroxylase